MGSTYINPSFTPQRSDQKFFRFQKSFSCSRGAGELSCLPLTGGEQSAQLLKSDRPDIPGGVVTVVCSLRSWGSGADLWGSDSDDRFEKPRIDDGLLEVVGVTGVVHMVSQQPNENRGNAFLRTS